MRPTETAYRPQGQPAPVRPAGPGLRPAVHVPRGADEHAEDAHPLPARSLLGAGLAARLAGALLRGRERYLLRVVVQRALEAEEHQQEEGGHQEDHLDVWRRRLGL